MPRIEDLDLEHSVQDRLVAAKIAADPTTPSDTLRELIEAVSQVWGWPIMAMDEAKAMIREPALANPNCPSDVLIAWAPEDSGAVGSNPALLLYSLEDPTFVWKICSRFQVFEYKVSEQRIDEFMRGAPAQALLGAPTTIYTAKLPEIEMIIDTQPYESLLPKEITVYPAGPVLIRLYGGGGRFRESLVHLLRAYELQPSDLATFYEIQDLSAIVGVQYEPRDLSTAERAFNEVGPMEISTRRLLREGEPIGRAFLFPREHGAFLSEIEIFPELRGRGYAKEFLAQLCETADRHGWILSLTPDGFKGSSVKRLFAFYKEFGFVPNKGRYQDFSISEATLRHPQKRVGGYSHGIL